MRLPNIHRSTLVVALAMIVLLAMLNAPGELVSPYGGGVSPYVLGGGGGGAGPITYTAEYVHGWPWLILYRTVDYDVQMPGAAPRPGVPIYGVPWLAWTSWEFWRGETWKLRRAALLGNAVVSLLLIVVVASAWEWRRRWRAQVFQFTLVECLVGFVVVAAPMGWWWHAKNIAGWEEELAASIEDKVGDVQQEYHGPLWLRRLVGKELLSPAFMRADSASIIVDDNDAFLAAVSVLRQFSYLRELTIEKSLDASSISYRELADLPGLKYLTLDHIVLDEDDVVDLAMLRQVTEIDLTDWQWQKPEIMQRLLGALPGCRFSEHPIYYDQSYDSDDRYSY
jgi:hypothetical protein